MTPRRAARVDANQPAMVQELRALGFLVEVVHQLPGFADLVVAGHRRTWTRNTAGPVWTGQTEEEPRVLIVEVKQPGKRDDLTDAEQDFAERWANYPYLVVERTEDVLRWFGWI